MAITLRHDAAAVALGGGGNSATRKFGQNLVLQQQKIAQDNLQRQQDRLFDLGRMRLNNQFQKDRDRRMIRADKDLMKQRMDAQDAQFAKRRQFELEDREAANKQRWIAGTNQLAEGRVAEMRGMFGQNQFTPEGQKLVGELSGELRAIEAQRDGLRPEAYNELLNQWLDKAEGAGLGSMLAPPPTIGDAMGENFKDLGTGYGVFRQPDGQMDVRVIDPRKVEEAKARASGGGRPAKGGGILQMEPIDLVSDPDMLMEYRENALEELRKEWEEANPYDMENAPEPTEDQLESRIFEMFERNKEEAAKADRFRKRMQQSALAMSSGGRGGVEVDGVSAPDWKVGGTAPEQPAPGQPDVMGFVDVPPIPMPSETGDGGGTIPMPNETGPGGDSMQGPQGPLSPQEMQDAIAEFGEQPEPPGVRSPAGTPVKDRTGGNVVDWAKKIKEAPDDMKSDLGALRSLYGMVPSQGLRDAVMVLADSESSSTDKLAADRILREAGIDAIELLNEPVDTPPPRYSEYSAPVSHLNAY